MDKTIDVKKRYRNEISKINYIFQKLKEDRYYEKSGAKMDGSLSTQISELNEKFEDLLDKIEYGKQSISE